MSDASLLGYKPRGRGREWENIKINKKCVTELIYAMGIILWVISSKIWCRMHLRVVFWKKNLLLSNPKLPKSYMFKTAHIYCPQFLYIRSLGMTELGLLLENLTRHWLGCVFIRRLNWERTHFQAQSCSWQISSCCITKGLLSAGYWLEATV